ncbi:MAG: hypothetical protein AAFY65_16315 [Pseudomonadota bacterium]
MDPDPAEAIRRDAARQLQAGLVDPGVGLFRAAAAGRAGVPGDILEIHAATRRTTPQTGPSTPWDTAAETWDLTSNVGDLVGLVTGTEISLRQRQIDGHDSPPIVTVPRAQARVLQDHARSHPVGLAALLLMERANPSQAVEFIGWFWHELAGAKKTDGSYVLRTGDDLIYGMRLGPRRIELYAYSQGQMIHEPMAHLSKSALAKWHASEIAAAPK